MGREKDDCLTCKKGFILSGDKTGECLRRKIIEPAMGKAKEKAESLVSLWIQRFVIMLGILTGLVLLGTLIYLYVKRKNKEIQRRESDNLRINLPVDTPFQHVVLT